ncbi:MAG TPA: IclR family transcriptional regulator [Acidimicrobiales bacterium]|nr:IclR family transcriptional regulator [Acidimicrobiales bacterium]
MGTFDKAVAVLDALADEPLALAGLVDATGLPRATAHRLATALEAHGLVRRTDDGRFALGLRLVALGRAAADQLPLAEAAAPALVELRDATGESVQLYVPDGDQRVCVAALESPHGLRTIVALGASLPLDRGSAGRALQGGVGDAGTGWVASVAEREPGVASVSAPVRAADGSVVAAVSVSGPIERTGTDPGARYGAAVARAASAIEAAAGLR